MLLYTIGFLLTIAGGLGLGFIAGAHHERRATAKRRLDRLIARAAPSLGDPETKAAAERVRRRLIEGGIISDEPTSPPHVEAEMRQGLTRLGLD